MSNNLVKKHLLWDEQSKLNMFTNQYITSIRSIDPVLAGILKEKIENAFYDDITFEGSIDELNDYLDYKLNENIKHAPTGFCKPVELSKKLAKFLNIDESTMLTRPQITSAIWHELKKRNLTDNDDKRIFRVNNELAELFNLNKEQVISINSSKSHTDPAGFNFCNIQKYIMIANNKHVKNDLINCEQKQELVNYITHIKPHTPLISIPEKFANWLGFDQNETFTFEQIRMFVLKELNKKNLVSKHDSRIFRVDKETAELFDINIVSANKSTNFKDENGFNILNLDQFIENALD